MTTRVRENVMDTFIDGVWRGSTTTTTSLLPNVVMAFAIIQAPKVTGLFEIVGWACESVMALWGLSGESATVLLAAVMSTGGGVSVRASLVVVGTFSGHDATVLLPAIYLMGDPVQSTGRCLGAAGAHPHYYPLIIAVCVINALFSIWAMQVTV